MNPYLGRAFMVLLAFVAAGGAVLGKYLLDVAVGPSPWIVVTFLAVVLASWLGGLGIGIVTATSVLAIEVLGVYEVPGMPSALSEASPALELTGSILGILVGLGVRTTRLREQVIVAAMARVSRESAERERRWAVLTAAVADFAAVATPLQATDLLTHHAEALAAGGGRVSFLRGVAPPTDEPADDDPIHVPVFGEAGPIGVLRIDRGGGPGPGPDAMAGLLALSRLAAAALDRIRLRTDTGSATQSAERSGDRLERLQALTADLAAAITAESIGEVVVSHALNGLSASVGLFYVAERPDEIRLAHARGYPIGLAGHDARLVLETRLPSTDAVRGGTPIVVESPQAWRTTYPGASDRLAITGTRSVVAYPIGSPPRGVLVVQRGTEGPPSEDDVALLEALNHQATQALERAELYAHEREARQLQEAFVGVMSHELRTPITTILAGSRLLVRGRGLDELGQELALDIEAEADRLFRLVEDLLVLSRLERGNLAVGDEPVLVARVAQRVVTSESSRWPATRFELPSEPGGHLVRGDETYVEQVLRNLLTNAAKYSPAGSTVSVTVDRAGDDISIRVLDEGPGVTSAEVEQLFSLFYRSPKTSASAAGAGIGLFVCRRLVDAMGGRVWARPRPEGGSEFGFSLGAYPDDEIADAEEEGGTADGNAEATSGVPSAPEPSEDDRTEAPPARV